MKISVLPLFAILLLFTITSCKENTIEKDEHYIDLADGFYYLNGTDMKYKVIRNIKNGGMYILNPKPIFSHDDYNAIQVVDEGNGNFGLEFDIQGFGQLKWDKVLGSKVHYIGFVYKNKLNGLIKIKGENSTDEVYLNCLSRSKEDAEFIKDRLLQTARSF